MSQLFDSTFSCDNMSDNIFSTHSAAPMWPKIYESDLKVIAISGLNLEKRVIQVNGAFDLLP